MPKIALLLVVGLLAVSLAVGGCVKAEVKGPKTTYPTLAEELRDLQRAKDAGAITQEEYVYLKDKICRSADRR